MKGNDQKVEGSKVSAEDERRQMELELPHVSVQIVFRACAVKTRESRGSFGASLVFSVRTGPKSKWRNGVRAGSFSTAEGNHYVIKERLVLRLRGGYPFGNRRVQSCVHHISAVHRVLFTVPDNDTVELLHSSSPDRSIG